MRPIDADKLETHEIYEGEWKRVVYADDIDAAPTLTTDEVESYDWEVAAARNQTWRDHITSPAPTPCDYSDGQGYCAIVNLPCGEVSNYTCQRIRGVFCPQRDSEDYCKINHLPCKPGSVNPKYCTEWSDLVK